MQAILDVVIPCYNAADTLVATVESVVQQKYVHTIWLVDDASSDDTREIMAQLAHRYPNIRLEYLAKNGGVAKARNFGALQSQADFVAFIDADDVYQPNALDAAYMALSQFHYLSLVRLKLQPVGFPKRYVQHPNFPVAWRHLEMTVGGNLVFRRSVFLACGGFPQDDLFRKFGGEDAALGIALTRGSVVGTLLGEQDMGVQHVYRQGIHAEKLLDSALFGIPVEGITQSHLQQAEAVSNKICQRLLEVKQHALFEQTGIMELAASYH